MAQIKVEFSLKRDDKGYRLIDGELPATLDPLSATVLKRYPQPGKRQRVVRNGGELVFFAPLTSYDSLYTTFADKARSPEGLLNFIKMYGSLTVDGSKPTKGDSVPLVIGHAKWMHQLLSAYETGGKKGLIGLLKSSPFGRISTIEVGLFGDVLTEKLELRHSVHSLIDGLWLQFAQAMSGGASLRRCEHCQELFGTGPGSGRRLDSKFCSDEHRIEFNSRKRLQRK